MKRNATNGRTAPSGGGYCSTYGTEQVFLQHRGRIRLPFIKKIKDTIKKYQRMSGSMMSHVCVREKEHQHREEMKGQLSNIRPAEILVTSKSPALKI